MARAGRVSTHGINRQGHSRHDQYRVVSVAGRAREDPEGQASGSDLQGVQTMSTLRYKHSAKIRKRLRTDPAFRMVYLCRDLDYEMDGVSEIPESAAAILNGIRQALNDLPDDFFDE